MMTPQFISVGHGVVIHDTKPDMREIEIALYEHVTLDKEYKKKKEGQDPIAADTAIDGQGNIILATAKEPDMIVSARWMNRGSNRITPPVLYAGVTVEVFKKLDTDRYFYEPMHIEPDLQGKEVVTYAFSNTDQSKKKNFGKHFDSKTSILLTVSTLENRIQLKTPTNNGEPIGFNFTMDMSKGSVTFDAGNGEKIIWDPANKKLDVNITTVNFTGSNFTINARSVIKMVTGTISLKASGFMVDAMTKFMKLCNHLAACRFNGKSKTMNDEHKLY